MITKAQRKQAEKALEKLYTIRYGGEWIGVCTEFPSLSWVAKTRRAALVGIRRLVKEVLKEMHNETKFE